MSTTMSAVFTSASTLSPSASRRSMPLALLAAAVALLPALHSTAHAAPGDEVATKPLQTAACPNRAIQQQRCAAMASRSAGPLREYKCATDPGAPGWTWQSCAWGSSQLGQGASRVGNQIAFAVIPIAYDKQCGSLADQQRRCEDDTGSGVAPLNDFVCGPDPKNPQVRWLQCAWGTNTVGQGGTKATPAASDVSIYDQYTSTWYGSIYLSNVGVGHGLNFKVTDVVSGKLLANTSDSVTAFNDLRVPGATPGGDLRVDVSNFFDDPKRVVTSFLRPGSILFVDRAGKTYVRIPRGVTPGPQIKVSTAGIPYGINFKLTDVKTGKLLARTSNSSNDYTQVDVQGATPGGDIRVDAIDPSTGAVVSTTAKAGGIVVVMPEGANFKAYSLKP